MAQSSGALFHQEGDEVRITLIGAKEDRDGNPTGVIDREHILKLYAWLGGILKR